jgi:hypothetical protein
MDKQSRSTIIIAFLIVATNSGVLHGFALVALCQLLLFILGVDAVYCFVLFFNNTFMKLLERYNARNSNMIMKIS